MPEDPKKRLKDGGVAPRLEYMFMLLGIAIVFFIAVKVLGPKQNPGPPATTNQVAKP